MVRLPGFLRKKVSTSEIGRSAEALAAEKLKELGYKIIDTNFRAGQGEVDIIAADGATLAFIEVKARASESFGTPFEAVDHRKQRRIASAASAYLSIKRVRDVPVRFDVVGVTLSTTPPEVTVMKNAFFLE